MVRQSSLRRSIVAIIVAAVLATSAVFGLAAFVFAYAIEDEQFVAALTEEAGRQQASWRRDAVLLPPERAYVRIYRDPARLPSDLRAQFAESPQRIEFAGEQGRHYHILRFTLDAGRDGAPAGSAIAVAEVGRYLIVRPQRTAMIEMLLALGLAIAASTALIGGWLAHRATAPLGRLAREIAGADGAIPRIVAADYPGNEIGLLAGALERSFRRIADFVDRERAFTRDASHELRTPVAVIRGAVDVIALRPDLPAPVPEALRRIEGAAADMTQALDLLLSVAREGERRDRSATLLLPLVEKAAADAAVRFPAQAMQLSVDVPADMRVMADAAALQLILGNLIGNGFQHAGGGKLVIRAEGTALVIADAGPGLGNDPHLFEPFARGVASTGSGLGLDIVRRLCNATGIRLSCRDADDGRGTQFLLEFDAG
ncbi:MULTISPECIES: sensor histidine kinase [unclassified Sphingopyxis]|uniref:sensor histidine kinase n=1 Tax=unclassified Sphingopyxis TaxID=2614943 RepID=UPI000736E7F8|nr:MULTISPECIES: HAMP domain-containing sensor histidine kinase [unclassified Sphingopyxis]KTE38409.1 hypothetical protein ATE62_11380 [Sphingopyxis sp. HIX]KTE84195.1 hypothetical protein ATE72_10305 [Sphingopyxis sp. HXXIV]